MRILCLFLLLTHSFELIAQDKHYTFESEDLLSFASYESLALAGKLSDYQSYPAVNLRLMGLPFDQIYHSANLKQMISVKFHLTPVGMKENEIIEVPTLGLKVTHIKIKGIWALVVTQGFETDELQALFSPKAFSLINFILPRAHAANCDPVQRLGTLGNFSTELQSQSLSSQIAQCLATGAQAMVENLKGTLDFYTRIVTEPMAVWREFKQGMEAFGAFIANIREETSQLMERLRNLDPTLQAELICSMTGSILASAGQALLLGPASFARALPSLTLKIRSMVERLSQLTRLTRNLPPRQLQGLSRELLQCSL